MKKILLIIIILISSFSYYGKVDENGEKITDFQNLIREDNTQNEINIQEDETLERTNETVITKDIENKESKSKKSNNTKEDKSANFKVKENTSKTVNTQNNKVETKKKETKQKTEENNEKKENIKTETNTNIVKQENIKEKDSTKVENCNHSGNWYNTKEDAVAVFNAEVKKWSDKWANYEIDNEEFYKNCPDSYEVYDCPVCKKWTINIQYN